MPLTSVALRFAATLDSADHRLGYLGPTLRGAFGYVLKATVCQMSHRDCARCLLVEACPYPAIFEGRPRVDRTVLRKYPAAPQPFVLDVATPASWDGSRTDLRWGIRLFGSAATWAPYVVETFTRIGKRGVGPQRVPYVLQTVTDADTGRLVWQDGADQLRSPTPRAVPPKHPLRDGSVRWRFHTPLHIRQGDGECRDLDGLALVLAGRRRWRLLEALYSTGDSGGARPPEPAPRLNQDAFTTVEAHVQPWGLVRFSTRQRQRVQLSGVIGDVVIDGPWSQAGMWMEYVECTHLGKYGTFGFGRVTWEPA